MRPVFRGDQHPQRRPDVVDPNRFQLGHRGLWVSGRSVRSRVGVALVEIDRLPAERRLAHDPVQDVGEVEGLREDVTGGTPAALYSSIIFWA